MVHIFRIIFFEFSQTAFLRLTISTLRHGALDQQGDTVAHKATHLIPCPGGEPVLGQSMIDTVRQIVKRVQERAVQIKYCGIKLHTESQPFATIVSHSCVAEKANIVQTML